MSHQTLVNAIVAEIGRLTNRRYQIKLQLLDAESLREIVRLLRDIDYEKRAAARRAQLMPWRSPS